jgi:hypothetical protein
MNLREALIKSPTHSAYRRIDEDTWMKATATRNSNDFIVQAIYRNGYNRRFRMSHPHEYEGYLDWELDI